MFYLIQKNVCFTDLFVNIELNSKAPNMEYDQWLAACVGVFNEQ